MLWNHLDRMPVRIIGEYCSQIETIVIQRATAVNQMPDVAEGYIVGVVGRGFFKRESWEPLSCHLYLYYYGPCLVSLLFGFSSC